MTATAKATLALARTRAAPQPDSGEKVLQRDPGSALGECIAIEKRQRMIAEGAYFRAKARNFAPGGELDDWIEVELKVDRALAAVDAGKEVARASAAPRPQALPRDP